MIYVILLFFVALLIVLMHGSLNYSLYFWNRLLKSELYVQRFVTNIHANPKDLEKILNKYKSADSILIVDGDFELQLKQEHSKYTEHPEDHIISCELRFSSEFLGWRGALFSGLLTLVILAIANNLWHYALGSGSDANISSGWVLAFSGVATYFPIHAFYKIRKRAQYQPTLLQGLISQKESRY